MTRAEIQSFRPFGRPFKPLATGLILGGFTLAANTFILFIGNDPSIPVPGQSEPSIVAPQTISSLLMGIFAGLSVLLMLIAWIRKSQTIYEHGLLLSFGAWTARWIGIALDGQPWYAVLPLSVSIMAAGAYWLEREDDYDGMK